MRIKLYIIFVFITTLGFSQENFVIQNVRLFDGEKVIKNASILIESGKIVTISQRKIAHRNIINGKGKTLLPAMTNAHVHVWNPLSLQQAAKAGVLNLLDMHAVESVIPMLKKLRTKTNYADYYCAGAAATVPKGHGTQYGFSTPTITKSKEAKKFISDRIKNGADYIKIIKEPRKATLNDMTIKSLIKEAHHQNKKAVVHISNLKDAINVLQYKADGLVHLWTDKRISKQELDKLQKEKFFVVPTLVTIQEVYKMYVKKDTSIINKKINILQKEIKKLYDVGIPILAGTDPPNANINYGTDLYKELFLLKEAGIPILDVLKSATSLPAIHFSLENKGFIKKGYRADFILVEGNPIKNLKDIANKKRVFKQGKEVVF